MWTFIDKEVLINKLNNNENIRIVDCRFMLDNKEAGKFLYKEEHLPGAVYFSLEEDLSGEIEEHGGRHPLPNMEKFKQVLENAGISNDTTVVAYDGGEGAFAARLWWMLKYVGHEKVYILDGGYKEWTDAFYPVEENIQTFSPTTYHVDIQTEMLATVEDVRAAIQTGDHVIIDSREPNRYFGYEAAFAEKAGHIPTALNHWWTEGFQSGRFKSPSEQEKRFKKLEKQRPIIVYCGSGVTGTPNVIALREAGYDDVKLYAGSYSDWISYEDNEIEMGEDD